MLASRVCMLHGFMANQFIGGVAILNKLVEHSLVLNISIFCYTVCHHVYVVLLASFNSKLVLSKFTNDTDHLSSRLVISVGGC